MPQFVHVLKIDLECDVRKRKICMYLFFEPTETVDKGDPFFWFYDSKSPLLLFH
jgi:hypothetical protein